MSESSDESLVGAKAAKLALLSSVAGIAIPPYFVVATAAFQWIMDCREDRIRQLDRLPSSREVLAGIAQQIREDIIAGDVPAELEEAICSAYHEFSQRLGEGLALVSVRSSATAEDGISASFAGQYATFLNVRGEAELLQAIRQVWASTYSVQAICYRKDHHYPERTTSMAVIVQKMVDATSAGTVYTVDPETGIPMICINAVPGLGVVEVSGEMTPTSWLIDPQTMTVIKRRKAAVPSDPLEAETLMELAGQVKRIGTHFRVLWRMPTLEAEFACDRSGLVFFTQVRPETVWSKGQACLTAVDQDRASHLTRIFQGGMTGCPGVATGVLRAVNSIDEAEAVIKAGDILLTPNTTSIWERLFGRIGGIITDIGGTGSHTAVVMREIGKPALVGAGEAMKALSDYDNSLVTLDATQRMVFAGSEASKITRKVRTVTPVYGSADSQTEEESWREAGSLQGRTMTDASGQRWICKPDYPVCRFMQSIYLDAHQWIGNRLQSPNRNEIHGNMHRIAFQDLFQWRIRLRQMTLNELEKLHEEREQTFADYLDACWRFDLAQENVKNWLMLYVRVNAFIGLGFALYKVTEGMLEEAMAHKMIVEPYYTQIRSARPVGVELESCCAERDLHMLAAEARCDSLLSAALAAACAEQSNAPFRTPACESFYKMLLCHTCWYKVTRIAEIDLSLTEAVLAVAREVINAMDGYSTAQGERDRYPSEKGVEFFPDDPCFQRLHSLTLAAEKSRQDSHHLRVRGHWLIREKLEQLAKYLVGEGRIGNFSELFDHSPDWLMRQVSYFEVNSTKVNGRKSHGLKYSP
jgi:phosphohistidine swiveling domain-containing protein